MSTFYLRIEGVNLSYVLEDTDQLSVVRGGSLLLRRAVKDIEAKFPALRKISTGASIGLFQFEADGEKEVKGLHDKIIGFLSKNWRYKHFTFVVDIQAASDNFLSDKEAVLARNRFRQLQQLSLAVPPPQNTKRHEPCKWDGLRSGNRKLRVREDQKIVPKAVSESIIVRHAHGRHQKQRFYAQEIMEKCQHGTALSTIKSLRFARDLHEIGGASPYRNLNDKIAVIYFDGNGFGRIQTDHCQSADALDRWDKYIQGRRCEFLRNFLLHIKDDPDFKTQDGRIRLESLLWGGDEITLVVPAWKGFETLHYFYQQSANLEFAGQSLTHAGGLVFCQVKTPIYRMRNLAKQLAENVKDSPGGRGQNLYEYMVLESIDYPAEPLAAFWQRRYKEFASCRGPLSPVPWHSIASEIQELFNSIPKGQVYAVVQAALDGSSKEDIFLNFSEQIERFETVIGDQELWKEIQNTLQTLFPGTCSAWPWIHLIELWDYLALQPEADEEQREVSHG